MTHPLCQSLKSPEWLESTKYEHLLPLTPWSDYSKSNVCRGQLISLIFLSTDLKPDNEVQNSHAHPISGSDGSEPVASPSVGKSLSHSIITQSVDAAACCEMFSPSIRPMLWCLRCYWSGSICRQWSWSPTRCRLLQAGSAFHRQRAPL